MADLAIREILKQAEGYEYALLTSFNYDFTFFERDILPILWSHQIQKVSLFVDADQLAEAVANIKHGSCALGRNYMISPIRVQGAFHPKVILLLGRQRAKVIVASANLTLSGYFHNGEVFSEIDYDNQHPEGLGPILSAIRFFEQLFARSHQLDKDLFDEIKELSYYGKPSASSDRLILTNMESSLLEQIKTLVDEPSRIDIAVPYYDNQLAALAALHSSFPGAELHLYLQNRKCRIAKVVLNTLQYVKLHIYKDFETNEKTHTRFFHGKAICFSGNEKSVIVYGSANCTASALLRTPDDGGNIECIIADRGEPDEFSSFFEGFIPVSEPLESEPLQYQTQETKQLVFQYGALTEKSSNIELYFDQRLNGEKLEITYSGQALNYEIQGKTLTAFLPIENLELADNVIEITFQIDDKTEAVPCWFINLGVLKSHRIIENSSSMKDIDYNASGDQYAQDMQLLLGGIVLSAEEEKLRQARRMAVEGTKQLSDEEDDSSDGIVSYVPPSIEDAEKYRLDKITSRILSERSLHLAALVQHLPDDQEIKNAKEYKNNTIGTIPKKRSATSAERRFSGFYKRRVNNLLSKEFVAISNPDRFVDSSIIFLEILDKYSLSETVEEVFQYSYAAETRAKIIAAMLEKCASASDTELREKMIVLGIDAILKNRYTELIRASVQGKVTDFNKEILQAIETRFHVREATEGLSLEDAILKSVWNSMNSKSPCLSYQYGLRYLDDLYGYKRWEEVYKICQKDYGSNVLLFKDNEKITVFAQREKLTYLVPEASFFELRRYAVKNGITRAIIVIQAIGELKGPDPAIEVRFEVDFRSGKGKQIVQGKKTQRNPMPFSVW